MKEIQVVQQSPSSKNGGFEKMWGRLVEHEEASWYGPKDELRMRVRAVFHCEYGFNVGI